MASQQFSLKRVVAECAGTFLLTFAVSASVALEYSIPTPLIAGLTLMVLVYLLGPVSGAHVNPAVTIGLLGLRKIKALDALYYLIAQFLGAFLAALLLRYLIGEYLLETLGTTESAIGELLGAFVFVFGVSTIVLRKPESTTGLVIGFTLLLGVLVASAGSLGVINPAVALGLGLFDGRVAPGINVNALVYLLMPIIGGLLAGQVARWIHR